ncbi:MAG: hypothetical protein H7838_09435 [Magnetococcus sp. DMHC-8]
MSHRLYCAISGHGFGHLAQTAALVNRLAEEWPDLTVHIVSPLPRTVLARMVWPPFSLECRAQDVGLVQSDPMQIDQAATLHALRQLHDHWPQHMETEQASLAAWQPDLLLADIPYLPIAAAAALGIPSVAIASLSWDAVLAAYFFRGTIPAATPHGWVEPAAAHWWQTMRQAYGQTTLALLPTPAILDHHPFPRAEPINPLTSPGHRRRLALRQALGLAPGDERPLVLVSLGGIPGHRLPIHALRQEERCHWLLETAPPDRPDHLHDTLTLLDGWSFADLSASVDGVVSKPGYGMAIAATVQQIPFLYRRRGLFPDEPPICQWIQETGRAQELTPEQFDTGQWFAPLRALLAQPVKTPPPANGAAQGAALIRRLLGGEGTGPVSVCPSRA